MKKNRIVKFDNVSFAYEKGQNIIENLNFEIFEGDFIGIKGYNGAGKTTLIKLLLGIIKAGQGQIVFSKNLSNSSIGYVRQNTGDTNVNFPASVLEIVMLGLYPQLGPLRFYNKNHKKMALKALSKLGVSNFANRKLSTLSGGQRQRVMIAKVIVNQPSFLVLDEPDSGVDEKTFTELFDFLKEINIKEKLTVLVISHNTEILEKYASEIFFLKDKNLFKGEENFSI